MPKPMYVWSGSAWVSVATEVESLATYATQSYANNSSDVASGLKPLVPSSVAIGSGSSSVSTLGQVSFTGASSVSLNDVFSTTYKNYKILLDHSASTALNTSIRLRVSNSDNTTANYARQYLVAIGAAVSGGLSTAQTSWALNVPVNNRASAECTLFNPFASIQTSMQVINQSDYTGSTIIVVDGYAFQATTSFTGFSIIASTGTITGSVSVYGYKD